MTDPYERGRIINDLATENTQLKQFAQDFLDWYDGKSRGAPPEGSLSWLGYFAVRARELVKGVENG